MRRHHIRKSHTEGVTCISLQPCCRYLSSLGYNMLVAIQARFGSCTLGFRSLWLFCWWCRREMSQWIVDTHQASDSPFWHVDPHWCTIVSLGKMSSRLNGSCHNCHHCWPELRANQCALSCRGPDHCSQLALLMRQDCRREGLVD